MRPAPSPGSLLDPAARRHLGRAVVHRDRVPGRLLHQLSPLPPRVPDQRSRPLRRQRSRTRRPSWAGGDPARAASHRSRRCPCRRPRAQDRADRDGTGTGGRRRCPAPAVVGAGCSGGGARLCRGPSRHRSCGRPRRRYRAVRHRRLDAARHARRCAGGEDRRRSRKGAGRASGQARSLAAPR